MGFEPTILATEGVKTVHALDRAATVTGIRALYPEERNPPTPIGKGTGWATDPV
jgi:hypothetical protein